MSYTMTKDQKIIALNKKIVSLSTLALEALAALQVYENLPKDQFPGPPTTPIALLRQGLKDNGILV